MKQTYEPKSILAPYITGHLAEKRALGYDYRSEELILYRFDRYCVANQLQSETITKDFLNGWLENSFSCTWPDLAFRYIYRMISAISEKRSLTYFHRMRSMRYSLRSILICQAGSEPETGT